MTLTVSNVSINKCNYKNDKLKKVLLKYGNSLEELLPTYSWHKVSFELKKAYSSLANGIRRTLMAEMDVKCLNFDREDLETTDDFIISDLLQKNINLVPINQDFDLDGVSVELNLKNNNNHIIDINLSHISIINNKTKSEYKHNYLFPEPNISIGLLSPDKQIKIKKFKIETGKCKQDAAKFTLLNNVSYEILDMEPYDVFTGKGDRSISKNPEHFRIGFKTKGNIEAKEVMQNCCATMTRYLNDIKDEMDKYIEYLKNKNNIYYNSENLEVINNNDLMIYKINRQYLTICNMIAQKIYLLDNNISYCNASVEGLNVERGIIKIKHPEPNKIFLDAITAIILDIQIISDAF